MATFRCLASGNTVSFTYTHDIDSMKGHAGYIQIDEPTTKQEERRPLPMTAPVVAKKPGRPPKQQKGT
jgi:hypothetical protein